MSLFSDIGNAISSAASFVQDAAKVAMDIAPMVFPQMAIAQAGANLLLGGVGQAVDGAVKQLCQEFGMPKFVGDIVKNLADKVLGGLKHAVEPGCQDHVGSQGGVQDILKDFVNNLLNKLVEHTRKAHDKECEGGGKGGKGSQATAGSWLQAIAIAMGEISGDKAAQMVELSEKMADLNSTGKDLTKQITGDEKKDASVKSQQQDNAREFSVVQSQFQATSQEFSILQNTFSNALKSIGEGLTTMGRKG